MTSLATSWQRDHSLPPAQLLYQRCYVYLGILAFVGAAYLYSPTPTYLPSPQHETLFVDDGVENIQSVWEDYDNGGNREGPVAHTLRVGQPLAARTVRE